MRRGPKAKSTRLKILDAAPGRKLSDREPAPERGRPTCPSWMSKEARAEWNRVVPHLDALGLLCKVDRAALAGYCVAWGELRWASEALEREGRTYKTESGQFRPHPAVGMQRSAWHAVRSFLNEFGLSPLTRAGITVPAGAGPGDPLGEFLGEASAGG